MIALKVLLVSGSLWRRGILCKVQRVRQDDHEQQEEQEEEDVGTGPETRLAQLHCCHHPATFGHMWTISCHLGSIQTTPDHIETPHIHQMFRMEQKPLSRENLQDQSKQMELLYRFGEKNSVDWYLHLVPNFLSGSPIPAHKLLRMEASIRVTTFLPKMVLVLGGDWETSQKRAFLSGKGCDG